MKCSDLSLANDTSTDKGILLENSTPVFLDRADHAPKSTYISRCVSIALKFGTCVVIRARGYCQMKKTAENTVAPSRNSLVVCSRRRKIKLCTLSWRLTHRWPNQPRMDNRYHELMDMVLPPLHHRNNQQTSMSLMYIWLVVGHTPIAGPLAFFGQSSMEHHEIYPTPAALPVLCTRLNNTMCLFCFTSTDNDKVHFVTRDCAHLIVLRREGFPRSQNSFKIQHE